MFGQARTMALILTYRGLACVFGGCPGQAKETRHGDVGCFQGSGGGHGGAAGGQDVIHQEHRILLALGNREQTKGILEVAAAATGA